MTIVAFAMFALTMAGGAAIAQAPKMPASVHMMNGMFMDAKGMTLYTFDKDTAGKSVCNGQCATNWPPMIVADGGKAAGDWTIVGRDDGLKQWAYKGKPVYLWVKDTKAGDTTGDGFLNGAWHIAKP